MTCTISWSDGRHEVCDDMDAAREAVKARYPEAFEFYDGSRFLVWPTETDSENDDGSQAIAELLPS